MTYNLDTNLSLLYALGYLLYNLSCLNICQLEGSISRSQKGFSQEPETFLLSMPLTYAVHLEAGMYLLSKIMEKLILLLFLKINLEYSYVHQKTAAHGKAASMAERKPLYLLTYFASLV